MVPVFLKKTIKVIRDLCILHRGYLPIFYSTLLKKNDPHIGVLAGFRGSGWDKLRGKNSLDLTVIGGL